ncbi:unnamed protein product [Didymodactylos carnosus]|uniref:Putative restriction endonuclease domain-containing protein n=1 Tax=Didymodactylos carnosus TaxID=1234261 RepID=A0A815UTP4_9BILA|nr:unnamed protein product [Didymodactylos carnosus]CAF1520673.1 unnamed protein product [Didymodactylos carnosus]CAF4003761.1 unnamed protein product [Didymodactylos carnosus]CAF4380145.1 unnamed protein product [Didymodactylos carnosus]
MPVLIRVLNVWNVNFCLVNVLRKGDYICGTFYQKDMQSDIHARTTRKIFRLLSKSFDEQYTIMKEDPIICKENVLEPDVVVVEYDDVNTVGHPQYDKVRLLIEVSLTSLKKALDRKVPIYADCNIKEFWIVDLNSHVIHVHRQPNISTGLYDEVQTYSRGESISPHFLFPRSDFDVNSLLF